MFIQAVTDTREEAKDLIMNLQQQMAIFSSVKITYFNEHRYEVGCVIEGVFEKVLQAPVSFTQ